MPEADDGSLRPFTDDEIAAMQIRTYEVRNGEHPTETRKPDENTMTRTFLVKWSERYNFVELCLGNSKTYQVEDPPGGGIFTTKLSRLLPAPKFGRHPTLTQLIASRVEYIRGHSSAGKDDANGMPAYVDAEVQIFYEHIPFKIRSDAGLPSERSRYIFVGNSSSSDAEAFTMPGGAMKYVTSGGTGPHGVPVPFNFSSVRPVERFTLWWSALPFSLLESQGALYKRLYFGGDDGDELENPDGVPFIGCVNSDTFEVDSAGQAYAPGQLLLEGVERIKRRSPLLGDGPDGWRYDVGFKLAFTPRGWLDLLFFDPATPSNSGYYRCSVDGAYYEVWDMPDNTGLFNVRPFTDLFNPNYL